jgi:AcrR family transcriptional regulator
VKRSPKTGPCRDEEARERIVGAAFGAFLERGYAQTSTLDIATRARVSKRELYSHFENKQALFAAGIAERSDRMRIPLDAPDVTNLSGLTATLTSWGTAMLSVVTDEHVLAVYRLAIGESVRSPQIARTLDRAGRGETRRALIGLLKLSQQRGLIVAGDPAALADALCSLLWSDLLVRLLLRVARRPSAREFARRAATAAETFLKLYAAKQES